MPFLTPDWVELLCWLRRKSRCRVEQYIYYADSLHVPYGEKPKQQVRDYIFKAVDFLAQSGIKALVVACNTATSIAVKDLRQRYSFPVIGMEPSVKPAVRECG